MSLINTKLLNVLSGYEFNKIYKDKTKFYKFLNDDLMHNSFKYELGLNVDVNPFTPNGSCSKGGLYFCKENDCHFYVDVYGRKLALVEIPDDAKIYIEQNKFKADKIILTDIINFDNVPDDIWINTLLLRYVKEELQTNELCILAVINNVSELQYVKEEFKASLLITV